MIEIYTDNSIFLDGRNTGLKVVQKEDGTIVYTPEITPLGAASLGVSPQKYVEHSMPHRRYSLATEKPLSGRPGILDFEKDIRDLLAKMEGGE